MKIDAPALFDRATGALRKRAQTFGIGGGPKSPDTSDPRPVLMWLAGAGYRPKEVARHKGMVPTGRGEKVAADRILAVEKPDDPVLAAGMRADILATLHREAVDDPRTKDIFDADPVLVADPETGWIVTVSMLETRIGLFDALGTLLGKPYMSDEARADMRETLVAAFRHLSPESQREWCHSEARLEEGLAFLENRDADDLLALGDMLKPVEAERGIWETVRLFGIAARMNATGGTDDPDTIAPLLATDETRGTA